MLYRIAATRSTEWNDYGRDVLAVLDENGKTVDDLAWEAAERVADDDTVRLALRFGLPSRRGLVVAVHHLVPLDHRNGIADAHAQLVAHRPVYRETIAKLEGLMPGGLAAEDESNRAIDESVSEQVREADEEVRRALDAPVKPELVDAWLRVGGVLPDPV